MNRKLQGSLGVAKAVYFYTQKGYSVFIPVSDTNRYDLLAEKDGKILRVEVKTTSVQDGKFKLRTSGGNQYWNGEVKRLSKKDCDRVYLFNIVTGSEKDYHISELEGRNSIRFR